MMVSTTFGYHAAEDRIWLSCTGWPHRLWLTRRLVHDLLVLAARTLEAAPPAQADARPAAERVAAEHDDSLNRPRAGESAQPLRPGRESAGAPELATAELCLQVGMQCNAEQAELVFRTAGGERRLLLTRPGLHRWLHALHRLLTSARWHEWPPLSDWLTRSHLPPALQALLRVPPEADGNAPAQRR